MFYFASPLATITKYVSSLIGLLFVPNFPLAISIVQYCGISVFIVVK